VESSYKKVLKGSRRYEKETPKEMASDLDILEIGAGKGEHLPYVSGDFRSYTCLDLFNEPEEWVGSENPRVEWLVADIAKYNFNGKKFDRIIIMCVLHHIENLFDALVNINEILKPGGYITLFLPSDPGILNRINRRFFVTPKSKKLGFSQYDLVNALEHHNHYWGIKTLITNIFVQSEIRTSYYPLNLKSANLSLFSIWNIYLPQDKKILKSPKILGVGESL
jgi:SAM-dependent methyltransferase